jgi:hypothetical protein
MPCEQPREIPFLHLGGALRPAAAIFRAASVIVASALTCGVCSFPPARSSPAPRVERGQTTTGARADHCCCLRVRLAALAVPDQRVEDELGCSDPEM